MPITPINPRRSLFLPSSDLQKAQRKWWERTGQMYMLMGLISYLSHNCTSVNQRELLFQASRLIDTAKKLEDRHFQSIQQKHSRKG